MIDPMISLAFAVYSNKGAYALLLGSGISRASGIPTGWEVVLDLVRKVAAMEKEVCEPDPAAWFRNKYGEEPDYSKLLDAIAKTPTERQQILSSYFEPTEEESSKGLKLPTAAHKAVAQLVLAGYVRVIITTNFDRLMELALADAGITPTVISTPDQLSGALPLAHSGATVLKIHGDYLDTRIKNTELELAKYDKKLNLSLSRIFDEYGLIVSGWSGDWDAALRAAIERCPTRRFTTYWTTRSPLKGKAKSLAEQRQAQEILTKDADHFFTALHEKVQALADMTAPHPLSPKMAAATVKRYLVDPAARIRLRDLVHEETERLFAEITARSFDPNTRLEPKDELLKRVNRYGALCETLLSVFVVGAYWGNSDTTKLWASVLQRIADCGVMGGSTYLINLRRYPALLLLYAAGIAAVAAGNYEMLASMLTKPQAKNRQLQNKPICLIVYTWAVMDGNIDRLLPGLERHHTPFSDFLYDKLREPLREFLPRDEDYQEAFDLFEYFLGLVHADLNQSDRAPVGCFGWRGREIGQENTALNKVDAEIDAQGSDWPPLKAGLFGGSLEQLKTSKARFDHFVGELRFW